MKKLLDGKTCVVTGSKGFLGRAICKMFIENGANVLGIDLDTNNFHQMDRVDVLVNCIRKRRKGFMVSKLELISDIESELVNIYDYCLYFKEFMETGSNIVNIGSIQGVLGSNTRLYDGTDISSPISYNIAKAGILAMTRYMATYWAKEGIRVNCVSPGGIYNNEPQDFVDKYSKLCPMDRMGKSHEVAGAVMFLASDLASYITGHNLIVDGGYTII